MGRPIRTIAARFALLLAAAAILPLVAFGVVSVISLQRGTHESIVAGNVNVATRAAEEIRRYISVNAEILKALAADLQNTGLERWQQDRILKNYVVEFREFREITLFDEAGATVATSRIGRPRVAIPPHTRVTLDGVAISPLHIDDDLLPTSLFAIHLHRLNQPDGWLVGEFSLEEMWRMVDRIRIGEHGYAMVIAPDGSLLAHGDPDKKALIAQGRNVSTNPLFAPTGGGAGVPSREYRDEDGRMMLGVAATIPQLGWTVVVEQPTREAYANATRLEQQLLIAISTALLAMVSAGYLFGRSFINPIVALQRATHAVAAGALDTRVDIGRADELGDLGTSFNTMANRLAELQEDIKKKERQAMLGRVAAGLVHDLSHPIQNIGNSTRLLLREDADLDAESRELFRKTIERELETLKRFMDDLRNLVKPKPVERFAMDINSSVAEIVESMRQEGDRHGITIEAGYAPGPLTIEGDRFALARVFRNLIVNAIQATQPGGRVSVATARSDDLVEVTVADTGSGIPPDRLAVIFEDFVTTKTRGLGLGLAISKRIVEQLDGTIAVESEVGRGTSFRLRFPARGDLAASAAAS